MIFFLQESSQKQNEVYIINISEAAPSRHVDQKREINNMWIRKDK